MSRKPLFAGLVIDENDNPVSITYVGGEPCYVVNDMGFLRHIPSEQVDRQVLQSMQDMIEGKESLISEQAAKMLGQEDIFTKAMIENQLKHVDKQFDALLDSGIPEEGRAYMGMMGFQIRINLHGEVLEINQPGISDPDQE
jgi:organic radical activating enzyme